MGSKLAARDNSISSLGTPKKRLGTAIVLRFSFFKRFIADTNCLLKTCQYEICDETTVDNAMQANESLLAPKIHCQDVNLLVFTWDATNDTLYFLEYSRNIQERNYTNLTADGHEILNGLLPDTDYIIKLTSLKVTESMFDTLVLRRSYPISIRTRKYPRTPLPVKSFEMCSIGSCHHENNTCTALVKWEPAEGTDIHRKNKITAIAIDNINMPLIVVALQINPAFTISSCLKTNREATGHTKLQ
ncbi:hypothetical protein NQ315_009215 [Exocentrus adspersus]|uniref:Fibronectin type-III domain-containing protein n=1 Tax=Exocentrus adspersus TaxID=1586481 RepID=A0AAV8WFS0_9CUCU|nr:hypothetical protein NQ315_009215 [Exocentrus adspersus]